MHPYAEFPRSQFWDKNAFARSLGDVDFDSGKRFVFDNTTLFATAGSCFAQHFTRCLKSSGGSVLEGECQHPLMDPALDHGYGLFSARYGNIYSARQLKELFEQALELRAPIMDFAIRRDGRIVDLLRPRAVPAGFASVQEAVADRKYHLKAVAAVMKRLDVFVFTLGLTETWHNSLGGYCYPIVPGAVAGEFDANLHRFTNSRINQVIEDLSGAMELLKSASPSARVLLTVSPVGLVATAVARHVVVSSAYSKSVLRVAAEEIMQSFPFVDYFPSYEIITSPLSGGRFFDESRREVTGAGVELVMEHFFRSRMARGFEPDLNGMKVGGGAVDADQSSIEEAIAVECEERFLNPGANA